MRLGQTYPSYQYYGTQAPGQAPQKLTDWDKFMQFNAVAMPVLSNILGTWMQGRYQAYSSQQMAEALKSMSAADRSKIASQLVAQQMLQAKGFNTGADQGMMQNLGGAFNSLPSSMQNQAFGDAFNLLGQGAGGNAEILAALNQQGGMFGAKGALSSTTTLLLLAGGGVAVAWFLSQKKS